MPRKASDNKKVRVIKKLQTLIKYFFWQIKIFPSILANILM